ncbi:hypothetical protein [Stenomitos frigidus]|nr:hypothetical protein [Stenomitos frigidus]
MHSLVLGLTAASVVAIAPAAFSQSNDSLAMVPATTSAPAVSPKLLSAAQMERIADILLGLFYFVLPVGLGLGIFLHDRYQQHRASILEEQIKLLEKLWEQSPQA